MLFQAERGEHSIQRLDHSAELPAARRKHHDVVHHGLRGRSHSRIILGSPRFQDEIAAMLGRRVTRGKAGRPLKHGLAPGKKISLTRALSWSVPYCPSVTKTQQEYPSRGGAAESSSMLMAACDSILHRRGWVGRSWGRDPLRSGYAVP
jgi:hypothetical protein